MPETYGPKYRDYPLSNSDRHAAHGPRDLPLLQAPAQLSAFRPDPEFGDVDVDSLAERMTCESGGRAHGRLDVVAFVPTGREAVGLRIRSLVAIKVNRVPVWREDPAP